jgi:hypothetical protein
MGRTKTTWKAFLGSVGLGHQPTYGVPESEIAEGPYAVTITGDLDHEGRRMEMKFTPERAQWVAGALMEYAARAHNLNKIYAKRKEMEHGKQEQDATG